MSTERWADLEREFERLVTIPGKERSEALRSLDDVDRELAQELRSLLDAHARLSSAVTRAPLETVPPDAAWDTSGVLGARVGPYEITGLLGLGGMGIVFEARRADGYFQRKVAIKLLDLSVADDASGKRFLAEGALLARLDHPHVVALLDAGMLYGQRPYLVMEFVEGQHLGRHCEERSLSRSERVELFMTICSAVSSAHQRLVVHLDLKPGNILVTPSGEPKLVDFGVARLVDGSIRDGTPRLRALTPEYASPEQLRGEPPGTASDVYSLGRILEELIEPEPAKASQRTPADLRAIIEKATAEKPDARYGSVDRLEDDLRRYCEGMPVDARELSAPRRAAKWLGRNRALAAGVGIVVLSLAIAVFATMRSLRTTKAHAALGWQAHADALRFAGLLQKVLVKLPAGGESAELLALLEEQAEESLANWDQHPEARGRTHEALGVACLGQDRLAEARAHFEAALRIARSDPGFDGNDVRRLERQLAEARPR